MKQIKYCLVALFAACVVNVSFAADDTKSSTTTASAKPSCGCKGKNGAGFEKPSSEKPAS